jgi:hypothetical protein
VIQRLESTQGIYELLPLGPSAAHGWLPGAACWQPKELATYKAAPLQDGQATHRQSTILPSFQSSILPVFQSSSLPVFLSSPLPRSLPADAVFFLFAMSTDSVEIIESSVGGRWVVGRRISHPEPAL